MSVKVRHPFEDGEGVQGSGASPSKSGIAWFETMAITAALPALGA